MGWSDKYKKSIDCDNPKGFSQRAHCQGRKKKLEEQLKSLKKNVGNINDSVDELENELVNLKDTSYDSIDKLMRIIMKKYDVTAKELHKSFVKKTGKTPDDWVKHQKLNEEGLRDWFGKSKSKGGKPGWVDVVDGDACAREKGETATPKCVSSEKRASMSRKERLAAQAAKRREDPNQPQKSGASKPTMVKTDRKVRSEEMDLQEVKDKPGKGSGKKDACYRKVKSRYDVWPSAYASGALVKCRKVGAANWGTKSEAIEMIRYCPACKKNETQQECKMGPKYWLMYSQPVMLSTNQMKYNISTVHPANEEKQPDHEHSMARSEISTIISAAKRLRKKMKGEGNIEAWVQSKITKAADYLDAAADYIDSGEHNVHGSMDEQTDPCWDGYRQIGMKKKGKKLVPNCVKVEESNDEYSNWRKDFGLNEASAAWQRKAGKNPKGGLNAAGVASYRRENPGSELQTAVTTEPSKLKPGSKDANRRKSFCARMGGMPGPMKDEKGRPTRKALSLRKWNC